MVPKRVTLERTCLKLESSVGALSGAYRRLPGPNQDTKQLPLDSPLIKLTFLPQNHLKYILKRLGTKGRLPTFKVERWDREFPIRKAPISVNMSGWSNSGIIRRPQRVLLQTSCNVWRWILLVNGFP